jgi:hypothetical protein
VGPRPVSMTRRRRWGRPFHEVPVENSPIHQWIRLEGRVTILVSYQVREQRIDVDVLPGPQGGRDPTIADLSIRTVSPMVMMIGLLSFSKSTPKPCPFQFAALMRGNLSILESARAAMRGGLTPRVTSGPIRSSGITKADQGGTPKIDKHDDEVGRPLAGQDSVRAKSGRR